VRNDRERLTDILRAIDHILAKTTDGRQSFESDELPQVWVLHHLQTIGEASRALSPEFRHRHPDSIWSAAAGMRNILVHHYFEIDVDEVWKVVDRDLTPMREKVRHILATEIP
jgi:uncharacterized protein with HEPN domain